jgi:two-component system LytT family response regulator
VARAKERVRLARLRDAVAVAVAGAGAQPHTPKRLAVPVGDRIRFIDVAEIEWIEAAGNYVRLHTTNGAHLLRGSMDGMERRLGPSRFIRLRRSILVQVQRIRELQPIVNGEYAVALASGIRLTSSRRYRRNLDLLLQR